MGGEEGRAVYAASFLRERRVVLDAEMLQQTGQVEFVLAHELMHFAWMRLSNERRREWDMALRGEQERKVRGEAGESAEVAKANRDSAAGWRNYVCESFCDSGAAAVTGLTPRSLGSRAWRYRAEWLRRWQPEGGWRI